MDNLWITIREERQPVDNFRHAALTSTYINEPSPYGTLTAQSPSGAHRKPRGAVACGVLVAIGIALCIMPDAGGSEQVLNTYTPKEYAYYSLHNKKEYICLVKLYGKESAWNYNASNGSHYGIPQGNSIYLLRANPYEQVNWGLRYIENRYLTPCNAWAHWRKYGWH